MNVKESVAQAASTAASASTRAVQALRSAPGAAAGLARGASDRLSRPASATKAARSASEGADYVELTAPAPAQAPVHVPVSHAGEACPACDPRVARSNQALRTAFIELAGECGLDGFTVNDLCQRAGLNRGTFYNHFHSKDELLHALEDEMCEELQDIIAELSRLEISDVLAASLRKKPLPVLVELFEALRRQGDFLSVLFGPGGDVAFTVRLGTLVCDDFVRSLLHERYRNDDSAFVKYYVSYFGGAYLGVIRSWISDGMKESSEEMALISVRLLFMRPGESIRM